VYRAVRNREVTPGVSIVICTDEYEKAIVCLHSEKR